VRQEVYAFLVTYQALRITAVQAAQRAHIDPDRLSFTVALRTARLTVITARATTDNNTPKIAADLLDPRSLYPVKRRSRTSGRAVKRPLSPFAHQSLRVNRRKHKVKVSITAVVSAEALTARNGPQLPGLELKGGSTRPAPTGRRPWHDTGPSEAPRTMRGA
jgi:hypothetical protein